MEPAYSYWSPSFGNQVFLMGNYANRGTPDSPCWNTGDKCNDCSYTKGPNNEPGPSSTHANPVFSKDFLTFFFIVLINPNFFNRNTFSQWVWQRLYSIASLWRRTHWFHSQFSSLCKLCSQEP